MVTLSFAARRLLLKWVLFFSDGPALLCERRTLKKAGSTDTEQYRSCRLRLEKAVERAVTFARIYFVVGGNAYPPTRTFDEFLNGKR